MPDCSSNSQLATRRCTAAIDRKWATMEGASERKVRFSSYAAPDGSLDGSDRPIFVGPASLQVVK
ncbi:cell envelope-related transcriptional attenuator [Anopheles sinensis]|uniref:Cell envelope-related transcriptional attenuator n=1 Tax=Anopheles sinensis TaxID=74873 RepID=A0A084VQK5_ANOSI|nr:cell envelope-related transcriptional attenuator [Anopheles sinensis]